MPAVRVVKRQMRKRPAKRQVEAREEPVLVQRDAAEKKYKAPSDRAGAQMAMMRKRWKKICENPECEKKFEGLAITNYCSDGCRFRAAYLRRIKATARMKRYQK